MIKLVEDYYKIWENDSYTLEATIIRSLWDDRVIKIFEKNLNKTLLEILERAIFAPEYLNLKIIASVSLALGKTLFKIIKGFFLSSLTI